jgi:hypothetical protein
MIQGKWMAIREWVMLTFIGMTEEALLLSQAPKAIFRFFMCLIAQTDAEDFCVRILRRCDGFMTVC